MRCMEVGVSRASLNQRMEALWLAVLAMHDHDHAICLGRRTRANRLCNKKHTERSNRRMTIEKRITLAYWIRKVTDV